MIEKHLITKDLLLEIETDSDELATVYEIRIVLKQCNLLKTPDKIVKIVGGHDWGPELQND